MRTLQFSIRTAFAIVAGAGFVAWGAAWYMEQRRAYLEIECDTPGIEVEMDGRVLGSPPIRLPLGAEYVAELGLSRPESRVSSTGVDRFKLDLGPSKSIFLRFGKKVPALPGRLTETETWKSIAIDSVSTLRDDRRGLRISIALQKNGES